MAAAIFQTRSFSQDTLRLDCRTVHDLAYRRGGTAQQRLLADQELRVCVSDLGRPLIAGIMFAGVRLGGSPHIPTSFRWGIWLAVPADVRPIERS
jgi:hypothetical protein